MVFKSRIANDTGVAEGNLDAGMRTQRGFWRIVLFSVMVVTLVGQGGAASFLDAWQEGLSSGKGLSAIAYGAGRYIAAGPEGELRTSSDGVNWQQGALPSLRGVNELQYGNGLFIAAGGLTNQGGLLMYSKNGVDWTTNLVAAHRIDSCTFGNGVFLASTYDTLLLSINGMQWYASPAPISLNGVDFAGDQFVAVGPGGQRTTSIDGIRWSPPVPGDGSALWATAYGAGTTVMVGDNGRIRVTTATNSVELQGFGGANFWDVVYGNGRFVALANLLSLGTIFCSTNGLDWEHPVFGQFATLYRGTFANGQFVVVGHHAVR